MQLPAPSRLLLLLSLSFHSSQGQVCQVASNPGDSLQTTLGITCEVTAYVCVCQSSIVGGASWMVVSEDLAQKMRDHPAAPGHWYVTDSTAHCVASISNWTVTPDTMECPNGFYCSGGLDPPRSCNSGDYCPSGSSEAAPCPAGFFCPFPGTPMQPCPAGGDCPAGSNQPSPCAAGSYCNQGQAQPCPKRHYCPYGSDNPVPCSTLALCPVGSKSQDVRVIAGLFLLAVAAVAMLGATYYEQMVQRGILVGMAVCVLVGLMWFVDRAIAGFLTLAFALVATNWALLQIGTCPAIVPRLLMVVTVSAALWVLWIVNIPWALLAGGLVIFSALTWLMSRQHFFLVMIGRSLMIACFVGLMVAYTQVDSMFTSVFGAFVLLIMVGLLASYALENRRQQRVVSVPVITRWRFGPGQLEVQGWSDGQSAPPAQAQLSGLPAPVTSMLAPPFPPTSNGPEDSLRGWADSTLSTYTATGRSLLPGGLSSDSVTQRVHGVSFSLEDVGFCLADGKQVLHDVSLRIPASRRVAVMGPSGSGKTTLLAVLSGRASYGRVTGRLLVGGWASRDLRFLQHVTGFVPQDDVLHGELTVDENIRYQAALRLPLGTTNKEIAHCVARVAKDLQLTALLKERVGTAERRGISGGQRKRVSIAMELVAQPLLLFADEPTSGLDSTTSHEVVRCLNGAAARMGSTVLSVIHQPRYETLCLFDDLILLAVGGLLVYSGPTEAAVEHFKSHLNVTFPPNTNPADIMLDAIQLPDSQVQVSADIWRSKSTPKEREEPVPQSHFHRERQPFFLSMLIYMDRSMQQMLRGYASFLVNYALCTVTMLIVCTILKYNRMDEFFMQSALAALALMLLQGVAAQRIFGADLLITWREARVGMPMVAYFVAKDLAALFEITVAAAVFTAAYGSTSGVLMGLQPLFSASWALVYAVFGLNYIFSIILSPSAAQMSAVVASFLAFCMAGVYQPQLPQMASMFGGRGWMVPALCPLRWYWGFIVTAEVKHITSSSLHGAWGTLKDKGYDPAYLDSCSGSLVGLISKDAANLREAWAEDRGWVCSTAPLILLGLVFRFLAGVCLVLYVNAHTSGWVAFFGESDAGAWKLAGKLFAVLVGSFLALFLFAEVWIFGLLRTDSFTSVLDSGSLFVNQTLGHVFLG